MDSACVPVLPPKQSQLQQDNNAQACQLVLDPAKGPGPAPFTVPLTSLDPSVGPGVPEAPGVVAFIAKETKTCRAEG